MADIGKPIRRIRVQPERVAPVPAPEPKRKEPIRRKKEKVSASRLT